MLRWLVALLLLANLAFYGWTHGWLDGVLGPSYGEREPQRLQQQLHPEAVRLLPPQAVAAAVAASATAATPPACLEAGPFDAAALAAAQNALRAAGVPAARLQALPRPQPGAWMVYMGRFADRDTAQRKAAELQRIHVPFEALREPVELSPGLSLGRFDTEAAAQAMLGQLNERGVHTARVVTLRAPATLTMLRAEPVEPALQQQLQALDPAALAGGFRRCERGGA